MDTRSISALLLKIAGLLLVGYCFAQLPRYFPGSSEPSWSLGTAVVDTLITLGPPFALGIGLWMFPGRITNRIVAESPGEEMLVDFHTLALVGIAILGLFLVARGVVEAAYHAFVLVQWHQVASSYGTPPTVIAGLVAAVVEVMIGVAFCIGRHGLARLVGTARGRSSS